MPAQDTLVNVDQSDLATRKGMSMMTGTLREVRAMRIMAMRRSTEAIFFRMLLSIILK